MITVTKQYRTETGHRLTNYNGKCAHLHGHSYLWELTVADVSRGNLHNSMVVDFKDVKAAMKHVLEPLDHAMVLAPDDPLVLPGRHTSPHEWDGHVDVLFRATNGEASRLHVWHDNPTAESFAQWALAEFEQWFGSHQSLKHVSVLCVKVWETANSNAIAYSVMAKENIEVSHNE